MNLLRTVASLAAVFIFGGMAAACSSYSVGDTGNPVTRRATWYSFLNGDDIRQRCARGGGDEVRLVFNADWREHLRLYEYTASGDGGGMLHGRVIPRGRLNLFSLSDPLGPWSGVAFDLEFRRADAAALWQALAEDRAFAPAPRRLTLRSNRFYWIVSGCRDGRVFFNAWQHPSDRYAGLRFPDLLRRYDISGIEWPAPTPFPGDDLEGPRERDQFVFRLEVTPEGLRRRTP